MKKRTVFVCIAVLIVAGLLWRFPIVGSDLSRFKQDRSASNGDKLPVASVLSIRPGVPAVSNTPQASLISSKLSPVVSENLRQYRAHEDYASLYQRLAGENSPEALYLKAEIYARCARQDEKSTQDVARENADRRAKFIANVSQSSKDTEQRIEAFDRLTADPCSGLDLGAMDKEQLARMVAAAADAGDVRAQALQLATRVEAPYLASSGQERYRLTEADFGEAQQLLASSDPEVIRNLQGILASTPESGAIRLAGEPIDPNAMFAALGLLACDAGAQCGAVDSSQILRACAYRGQCFASNLYEYSYYYENAPSESQQVDLYRQALLAMLTARNFSGLTYSPTDSSSGYSVTFGRVDPGG